MTWFVLVVLWLAVPFFSNAENWPHVVMFAGAVGKLVGAIAALLGGITLLARLCCRTCFIDNK